MFIILLVVTFVIALVVSFIVVKVFDPSIARILTKVIPDEISSAWHRYLKFAIIVVGVSGGVRVWQLEQYILPRENQKEPLVLTSARWTLEVYRTIIGSLQSIAWLLLVFFVIALIAYVIVRGQEMRRDKKTES